MIIFKEIRYRNFLSAGDQWTTVRLDTHATTLLVGKNGEGKSLLTDAISFACFGKAYRKIKKAQLVNSINEKQLEVQIDFSEGSTEYMIHRGIKPNIFKIYKSGKLLDESSHSRDYQSYLEQNVMKMNQRAFNQIVILGSAEYIPFMQLPTWHRREVIEELLDIRVFSHMKIEIKGILSNLNDELTDIEKKVAHTNTIIREKRAHQVNLQKVLAEQNQNVEEKKAEIQTKIDALDAEMAAISLSDNLNEIKNNQIAMSKKHRAIVVKTSEMAAKERKQFSSVKFFKEHSSCPTCKGEIDEALRADKITSGNAKLELLKGALDKAEALILDLDIKISDCANVIRTNDDALQQIKHVKHRIADYNQELTDIENKSGDSVSDSMITQTEQEINDLYDSREDRHAEKDTISESIRHYTAALEMLKDTGIKQQVISQYLPVMNQLINKYLEVFEFFVLFTLDGDFNETIRSRHRDNFSYSSFSEGEKSRINLALMFCWREIARIKNSAHTNLLIFDETLDQSLDNDGVEKLMTVISQIVDKSNIIVISHRAVEESAFTRVLEAKKVKNFSTLREIS